MEQFIGLMLEHKYELEALLGAGGMGLVFQAHDFVLERRVAVKIIRPEYAWTPRIVDAFIQEAHTIAHLEHPYILRVYGFGTEVIGDKNLLYLVMNFASGGSLADRLKRGPLPLNEVERILRQICEAMDYAHQRHVVHLDLKPLNILFDQQGNVQLADFGIARLLEDAADIAVDVGLGTRNYIPPEQLLKGEAGSFSDIYAIGIILYGMVTGTLPERLPAGESDTIRIDDNVPVPLRDVIATATRFDPGERFKSPAELFASFEAALRRVRGGVARQKEEARRLDAAMPGQTVTGRPTEVWVQICLPNSPGFRDELPQVISGGDEITRENVREGALAVVYPINPETGKPDPVRLGVELKAPDFVVDEAYQEILLFAGRDSGKLLFPMVPQRARQRSIVHVSAKQKMPDGSTIILGSAALSTKIQPRGVKLLAHIAWGFISLPLSAVAHGHEVEAVEEVETVVPILNGNQAFGGDDHTDVAGLADFRPAPAARRGLNRQWSVVSLMLVAVLVGVLLASQGLGGTNKDTGSGLFGAAVEQQAARAPDSFPTLPAISAMEYAAELTPRSMTIGADSISQLMETGIIPGCSGAAFSPDSALLACSSEANTVLIWNITTAAPEHTLNTNGPASRLALSSYGLAVAEDSGTVTVWEPTTGSLLMTVGGTNPIRELAFSPDGRLLVVVDEANVMLVDTTTGESRLVLDIQADGVTFSPDGTRLASYSGQAAVIQVWDMATGAEIVSLDMGAPVDAAAFSPNGSALAATGGAVVRVWNVQTWQPLVDVLIMTESPDLAFSPDDSLLVTTGERVQFWDAATGASLGALQLAGRGIAFSADGTTVAIETGDGINLWTVSP